MPKGQKVKPKFKQMAFETAVRNPERYKGILAVLRLFEKRVLNDELILDIIVKLFLENAVTSGGIREPNKLSLETLKKEIIRINSTRRADGGFPSGYQSRFWTYVRTLSEMGFVYARYKKKLILSNIAHKLVKEEIDEQEAFAVQAMKYNRKSPYRNVSNDFNYFRFLLEVLLAVKGNRINYEQFILSLFSKNGDVKEFVGLIGKARFRNVDEVYRFVIKNKLSSNKKDTIVRDYPDVVLRLLKITGFVTIAYKGIMFIEPNELKTDFIKAMLAASFKLTDEEKSDEVKFFKKLDSADELFLPIVYKFRKTDEIDGVDYAKRLAGIVDAYKLKAQEVADYILNKSSVREEFKYIPEPLKLEFFVSLLVAMIYGKDFKIKPNYKADSIGMPISHAPGQKGDIEVASKGLLWLIEVTLIQNKTQQLNSETTSVIRHFNSFKGASISRYLSFIAPYVHEDTENFYKNSIIQILSHKDKENIYLKPYKLSEFVKVTLKRENFKDMQEYSENVFKEIKDMFN